MDQTTVRLMLASVGVSFALGFGMAWHMRAPEPVAAVVPPAAAPQVAAVAPRVEHVSLLPHAVTAADADVDTLWARALLPADGYDAEDRLRKLAHSNPVALRSLLNRYSSMQAPQARGVLMSVLSTVQTPEVAAFAARLAASSNAAERQFGFELLQGVAPDAPETRALVRRTLASEQSPAVLVQALGALQASAAEPEESEQVVAQLKALAQHADPGVRSQSIGQLGQWDKKGEAADLLSHALSDVAPQVRQAAIFAISQSGLRTDAAKGALMGVLNNAQESKELRGSALQALERFALSKEEYARFAQTRKQLLGTS